MGLWRQLSGFVERARRVDPDLPDPASFAPDDGDCPRDRAGRDTEFTLAVIALGAKLAKADGFVTVEEERAFHDVFQTEGADAARAEKAFARAGQTTLGFEGYATRLARRWRAYPCLMEDVLDGLFHIAAADGRVTEAEVAYIARVAELFGFSEREFARIKASWLGRPADDPYLVLGVDPDISDDDLRRAYRRMAAANHPDHFTGRGMPLSAVALAHEKMAAVNAAYDAVRRARGLTAERPEPSTL